MRSKLVAAVACTLLVVGGVASASDLREGVTRQATRLVMSDNVSLLKTLPEGVGAIAIAFSSDTPHMYLSTLKAIQVYDTSDPKDPQLVGVEPLPHYQNEGMSLGERRNGDKFLLVASGAASVSPRGYTDSNSRYVTVVDVTDPTSPEAVGGTETDSRTHTVSCTTPSCEWAYSDGRTQGKISIIDLRNWREPKMATTYESVVPQGHDQDVDEAGIMWHVGGQGAVALNVKKATKPVPLASTNFQGVGNPDREKSPWNNFILHNSARPNAKAFKPNAGPSLKHGNVLLATEEDTAADICGPHLGSFSTWHIPYVDAKRYKKDNPKVQPGNGRITPLALWYPEDAGVAGANCSAHYFDYHKKGFVGQGWYELGTRILDVRNPRKIKQIGFFVAPGATETWGAWWVPQRNKKGKVTGRSTNILYTADAVRGVDVLEIDLPAKGPKLTQQVVVPVDWKAAARRSGVTSLPSDRWGWACRIPLS